MDPSVAPPYDRPGFYRFISLVTWGLVLVSLVLIGLVTKWGLWFAHEVTCQPPAPVEYRQHIVISALIAHLVLVLPAIVLLIRGRRLGTVVAAVLTCSSLVVPACAFLIPVISAALC